MCDNRGDGGTSDCKRIPALHPGITATDRPGGGGCTPIREGGGIHGQGTQKQTTALYPGINARAMKGAGGVCR